jgi:drug/metabolite transporter superfamily protein YnfA
VISNIVAFVIAALLEIAGCFAFWIWLRRRESAAFAVLGIIRLCVG